MFKLAPIILAALYALVVYFFSAKQTAKKLDRDSTPLADPHLEKQFRRLAAALDLGRITVHVLETPAINGLASPDGRVFITRGFYRQYLAGEVTAAEIASVVAHELGHVALGHTRRRMIDF